LISHQVNVVRQARSIYRELTPEEQSRLETARKQVQAELPQLIERGRMAKAFSEEDTPSGALRRAIQTGDLTLTQIARRVDITTTELDMFLTGEATLPSDVIDRLAEAVGLRLVPME
jgi:DNA-binding phage protein